MAVPAVQGCRPPKQRGIIHVPSMVAAASVQDVALHYRHIDYIVATDLFSASLAYALERRNVTGRQSD